MVNTITISKQNDRTGEETMLHPAPIPIGEISQFYKVLVSGEKGATYDLKQKWFDSQSDKHYVYILRIPELNFEYAFPWYSTADIKLIDIFDNVKWDAETSSVTCSKLISKGEDFYTSSVTFPNVRFDV